ncbi:MAG: lipase family protein [Nitrospira sp.]|nr:lipase family protein [Nitrospira sp.]
MQKPIPPPSLETILPPNLHHDYFAEGALHPFRPRAVRYQPVNAWWLAEAALLAYADGDFARNQFQQAGFTVSESQPFSDHQQGTQCYVAHNDQVIFVVFRGTQVRKPGIGQDPAEAWREILKDWKADGQFQLVPWEHGGSVHKGFTHALGRLWEGQVHPYVQELNADGKTRAVWFTGHSLGAALATLAADQYAGAQGLYTYGSPLVGDAAFASDFHVSAYRIVNNNDIVARIPPWGPYGSKRLKWGSFEHVGLLKYLDEQGALHDNPTLWKRVKHGLQGGFEHVWDLAGHWSKGEFGNFPIEFLNDHAPLYYALRLWNAYDKESSDG